MRVATVAAADAQAPLGSGMGSFVQVFELSAPPSLQRGRYVNHAHNEFAQWWLEAGWLGLLVLAVALAVLVLAGWRLVALRIRSGHAALAASGFVAICATLAHSWADYPLRTPFMMVLFALGAVWLAGCRRPGHPKAS